MAFDTKTLSEAGLLMLIIVKTFLFMKGLKLKVKI